MEHFDANGRGELPGSRAIREQQTALAMFLFFISLYSRVYIYTTRPPTAAGISYSDLFASISSSTEKPRISPRCCSSCHDHLAQSASSFFIQRSSSKNPRAFLRRSRCSLLLIFFDFSEPTFTLSWTKKLATFFFTHCVKFDPAPIYE